MASSIKIVKRWASDVGALYKWERDDNTEGYVIVDEKNEIIRPSTDDGEPIGRMRLSCRLGNIQDPDPLTRGRFLAVAAAICQEWEKIGSMPDVINRNFG